MPEGEKQLDPKQQVAEAHKAFEQEFAERFAHLRLRYPEPDGLSASDSIEKMGLSEVEVLAREFSDFRSRHTGKKSALASAKKMIGRVAPEERAAFGQLVQQTETEIVREIDNFEFR